MQIVKESKINEVVENNVKAKISKRQRSRALRLLSKSQQEEMTSNNLQSPISLSESQQTLQSTYAPYQHLGPWVKSKYYFAVMWTLQWLHPFLCIFHKQVSRKNNSVDSVKCICQTRQVPEEETQLQRVWELLTGAPESLHHCGVLSYTHLYALSECSDKAIYYLFHVIELELQIICHSLLVEEQKLYIYKQVGQYSLEEEEQSFANHYAQQESEPNTLLKVKPITFNLFPVESELRATLWPEKHSQHEKVFIDCLCHARDNKAKFSTELLKEGYLHESGMSAINALCRESAECTNNNETLQKEQWSLSEEKSQERCKRWRELIDLYTLFLPDRSAIHELENLPQEIAIGEIITSALENKEFWQEKCCNEHHAEVQHLLPNYSNTSSNKKDNKDDDLSDKKSNLGSASSTSSTNITQSMHEEKLHELTFHPTCVVDVGGGNGFLAAMLAERLHCTSVVIDPYFPPHAIDCCPRIWPDITTARSRPASLRSQLVERRVCLFDEFNFHEEQIAIRENNNESDVDKVDNEFSTTCKVYRTITIDNCNIVLVAKHLCGSAIDNCLRHCEEQQISPLVYVLASCCFHKGSRSQYIYPSYLAHVLHVEDDVEYSHLASLTDWTKSVYQITKAVKQSGRVLLHELIPCMESVSATVQCLINYGRMLHLHSRGYNIRTLEYVPSYVTTKNKCIIAIKTMKYQEELQPNENV